MTSNKSSGKQANSKENLSHLLATELTNSAIDPRLWDVNFELVSGKHAFEEIYGHTVRRTNAGILVASDLRNYYQFEKTAGFICRARDIDGGLLDYFQYKALQGKILGKETKVDKVTGEKITIEKERKYIGPTAKGSYPILPYIPFEVMAEIARKYGKEYTPLDTRTPWRFILEENLPVDIREGDKKALAVISQGTPSIGLPGIDMGVQKLIYDHKQDDWITKTQYKNRYSFNKPEPYADYPYSKKQRKEDWRRWRLEAEKHRRTLNHEIDDKEKTIGQFKHELHPFLKQFCTPGRKISVGFDNDSKVSTQQHVKRARERLLRAFRREDLTLNLVIKQHPKEYKGVDDYLVTGKDFDSIPELPFGVWDEVQNALDRSDISRIPDIEINSRYLGELPKEHHKLTIIRSDLGTGKTFSLQSAVADSIARGNRVIGITYRQSLGRYIGRQYGIPYLQDEDDFTSDEGVNIKRTLGYVCCLNSFHRLGRAKVNLDDLSYFDGALIILDEIQQILGALILNDGNFLGIDYPQIVKTFVAVLRHTVETGGKIIALDANMNEDAIYILEKILGCKAFVIKNNFKVAEYQQRTIINWEGKNADKMIGQIVADIQSGKKLFIYTDSQKAKSKLSGKNLYDYIKKVCPNNKGMIIDSETVTDKESPAYRVMDNLDYLTEFDYVVSTPSIEAGVSLEGSIADHFDSWYGFACGLLPVTSLQQAQARIRKPIPRHVCLGATLSEKNNQNMRYTTPNTNGEIFHQNILTYWEKNLKINSLISDSRLLPTHENLRGDIIVLAYAKIAALANICGKVYTQYQVEWFRLRGYTIISSDDFLVQQSSADNRHLTNDEIEEISNVMQQISDTNLKQERQAIIDAVELTEGEAKQLSRQEFLAKEDRYALKKYSLKSKTGGRAVDMATVICSEDRWWLSRLRLDYYRSRSSDLAVNRDIEHTDRNIKDWEKLYPPKINLIAAKANFLRAIGIEAFLQSGEIYSKESESVQKIISRFDSTVCDFVEYAFRVRITKDKLTRTPMKIIKALVESIGHTIRCKGRKRYGDIFLYEYVYGGPLLKAEREYPNLRTEVFECWDDQQQIKDCAVVA